MVRSTQCALLLVLLFGAKVFALREIYDGNTPTGDHNWPAGSTAVANLPQRLGFQVGDGGFAIFSYSGDGAALQTAVDAFAGIRAQQLQLFVEAGPHTTNLYGGNARPRPEKRVDWEFEVWDREDWSRWHDIRTPLPLTTVGDLDFNKPLPPKLTVYLNGQIEWARIKVPSNVTITDNRADANGIATGPAVRGDVYAFLTSKPIAGAQVRIEKPDRLDGKQTTVELAVGRTDENGHFELAAFPAGTVRVSVQAEGYAPCVVGYYAELRDNSFRKCTAYLLPAESISGSAVDTNNKPLANVDVEALGFFGMDGASYTLPGDRIRTKTDADGKFSLSGLPRGVMQLRATSEGLYHLDSLVARPVPGTTHVVKMAVTGFLRGKVTGVPGRSPPRVEVRGEGDPIGKWGGSAQINPDGTFEFKNIPPGKYIVSANFEAMVSGNDPKAGHVEIKPGETAEVEIAR